MIDVQLLKKIPEATDIEVAGIQNYLEAQYPAFVSQEDYFALIGYGGTIQSAYIPSQENIAPVPLNLVWERVSELQKTFSIASPKVTSTVLLTKDSRDITNSDLQHLIHVLNFIKNKRVLVSCGTYMLPIVAQVLDLHFGGGRSDKVIAVIGSWLPASQMGQDVDFNIGGGVAAVNAFCSAKQQGIVFAQFHGEVFMGDEFASMNLHPPHVDPRFVQTVPQIM